MKKIKVKKRGCIYVNLIPKLAKIITKWLHSHQKELYLTKMHFDEEYIKEKLNEQQRNVTILNSSLSNCWWKITAYSPPGSNWILIHALFKHATLGCELSEKIVWGD